MRTMPRGLLLGSAAVLRLALSVPALPAAADAEPVIVATADADGQAAPVLAADAPEGVGGLSRRAAEVARLRAAGPVLLVDAGGFLAGGPAAEGQAAAIAAAYEALAYDAANVGVWDLRRGRDEALERLRAARFPVISASLADSASGKLLFPPYVVREAGGRKTAFLGLTERPGGAEHLPRLREALEGIQVAPLAGAAARWLPEARAKADRVVVLYHGSAAGLRTLLDAARGQAACVIAGLVRREAAPSSPSLFVPPRRGEGLLVLRDSGDRIEASTRRLGAEVPQDPAMDALLARLLPPAARVLPGAARDTLAALPAPGAPLRLDLAARNRSVRVRVRGAALLDSFAGGKAGPGRAFLALETEWENAIPLLRVKDLALATEYRVPSLRDHVYLVADGRRVERIAEGAESFAGHLPLADLKLPRLGSTSRGWLLFDVPAAPPRRLELRFYDFAHGHFVLPLLEAGEIPAAQPIAPPARNEVVEAGVFGLSRLHEIGGEAAPPGLDFLVVDLRCRSLFTQEADATAFDPKAKAGARIHVGTVADWKESRRHLQIVVDGEVALAPLAASDLPEEPRFLPDLPTGGGLVFLAPDKAASLELRCDFPNARSSQDGRVFRPAGITLALEGRRPRLDPPKAVLGPVADDPFQVAITAVRSAAEHAREAAADGERFVVLAVTVQNAGRSGETFQPIEQLRLVTRSGQDVAMDLAAARGPRPALPLLLVPAGERRSFDAAYRLPAAEATLRLSYRGGSFAKVFDLPALDAASVAAAGAKEKERPVPAPAPPPAQAPEPAPAARPVRPAAPPPAAAGKETAPSAIASRAVKPPREPKGIAGVGLTPEKVNEAIDRGAAFLWRHILEADIHGNRQKLGQAREHSIAALALVHAGAHKRFPDFDAGLREHLASIDIARLEVYQAGILCMLVEAYGDPSYLAAMRGAVRYLLELQGAGGSWSYARTMPAKLLEDAAADRVLLVSGGRPLEGAEAAAPLARRSDWKEGLDGDNSASQYALLGLHAASRSGVPVAPEVWRRSLEAYRERQGQDGNWYYHGKSSTGYGSMTCAGICAVALARHELGEADPGADPAIESGLAWLDRRFSVEVHPDRSPPDQWFYYYLYSLERVGRVLGAELIGAHEWYPLGARRLVDVQGEDGGWRGKHEEQDPRLATSFALLFLTRATSSLRPVEAPRGGDGTLATGIQLPRGSRYYFILDASGSMTAELDGRAKWAVARDAVARLVEELPETAEVALRVYGHRKRAIEEGANEDTALEVPLRRLVKKDVLAKLASLKPRGKTPMARSLLEARRDLGGGSEGSPVTLVLLTDGGEDTQPRQDPLAAAAEIGRLKGVRFHVVGFDIGRDDWKAQLEAMARRGAGRYWPVLKADGLFAELRAAVFGVPAGFTVHGEDGRAAGAGRLGDAIRLREGRYLFRVDHAGERHEAPFWINAGATTSVVFNAARAVEVGPSASPAPPAPPVSPAPPPKPRFCTACGKPLGPAAKFCSSCGSKVDG